VPSAKSLQLRRLFLVISCLGSTLALSQQLENGQFKVAFTSTGISSLKRVQDVFDTEYILGGRSLGEALVRYRAVGGPWKEVSSGTAASQRSPGELAYQIGRAVPTVATESHATSSIGPWGTRALNDQIEPKNSHDTSVPFFAWGDRHGTEEWVEYDFRQARQISSVEVYWAIGSYDEYKWALPVSWKVQYREGDQWKDVHAADTYGVASDQFNRVNFEPVTTVALRLVAKLPTNATSAIYEWRVNTDHGKDVQTVQDIDARATFRLVGDSLIWTIDVHNPNTTPLEIGDLGIALPFNTEYVPDKTETYTKRLVRHSFIGGDGSYVFWMRCNGIGPYLVMLPEKGTQLEYYDQEVERAFTAYIHSAGQGEELAAKGGKWRLPNTKVLLAPKGQPGDSATFSFKFRWAKDYENVRDVVYEEGGIDVNVVPGMTVPTDLPTMFSLRSLGPIRKIAPEFPDHTEVMHVAEGGKDRHVYSVKFSRLGENMLKVEYGDGQSLALDFFVTEPLEILIKKRARFLVANEQWNDLKRWYYGLYSQWDMKHQVLRSPDDLDGLQSYAVASDDPELGKAPYLAAKNVFFPDRDEISSLEKYIEHYVWGGLQQTGKEPYPYGIYGIPNWKVNRENPEDNERGKKHLWRIYDYPHVIALYYYMYLVARNYPSMVHSLDAAGYLQRAYGTAIAFFTVPMEIVKWSAYETGTYNEVVIPDLIRELEENGRKADADKLRAHWEKKVAFFVNAKPDLFQSEYPFDSTGFESTHALAKYAVLRLDDAEGSEFRKTVKPEDADQFLEEQMRLNLSARGTEPAYYWLGSDYRASGNTHYTLSYMSQMGGWAVEDYGLKFAKDPVPYLRLGYASYLSSWALLNSGTSESNYGYWFPGKENDGGAGGGFEPRPWGHAWLGNKEMGRGSWWYSGEIDLGFTGALRTAATVVTDDPIFGLYAYGGDLKSKSDSIEVIPKDGLRDRFAIVRGTTRFCMQLDRDGFAENQPIHFTASLNRIEFLIENRTHDKHQTALRLSCLPDGTYHVLVNHSSLATVVSNHRKELDLSIPISQAGGSRIVLSRD